MTTNRKNNLKMFTEFKKSITFAPTVLATLQFERTAYQGGSFAFIEFHSNNITPFMTLLTIQKSILRGHFFYSLS